MRNLVYIIEGAGWSTDWDGQSIISDLPPNEMRGELGLTKNLSYYRNKIVHLGSFHLFFQKNIWGKLSAISIDPSNKVALTIFHLDPADKEKIMTLSKNLKKIDLIHTSCQITRDQLIAHEVPAKKIIVIPLGVNLEIFKPAPANQREQAREKLGIAKEDIVIGSFQKDGQGWGEGLEPKLIKGPDIFCEVVERLAPRHRLHILLTGPARGYVKDRLKKARISFTHHYLDHYEKIGDYFHGLDYYLISSRIEGGPKAILESWACGIPVVSTTVGMVPDIASNNHNVLLADSENIAQLASQLEKVITNAALGQSLRDEGLKEAQKYSWKTIAERYYKELYKPLV